MLKYFRICFAFVWQCLERLLWIVESKGNTSHYVYWIVRWLLCISISTILVINHKSKPLFLKPSTDKPMNWTGTLLKKMVMTDKYNMTDSQWLLVFFSPDDVYWIICNYIVDIILINGSFVVSDVNCNLILFVCVRQKKMYLWCITLCSTNYSIFGIKIHWDICM